MAFFNSFYVFILQLHLFLDLLQNFNPVRKNVKAIKMQMLYKTLAWFSLQYHPANAGWKVCWYYRKCDWTDACPHTLEKRIDKAQAVKLMKSLIKKCTQPQFYTLSRLTIGLDSIDKRIVEFCTNKVFPFNFNTGRRPKVFERLLVLTFRTKPIIS